MNDKKITNFALNIDKNTQYQFDSCSSENFVKFASLMPDAHSGYVAPIGSVLVAMDVIVPSWVGYDIGCGMIALKFNQNNLIEKVKENADEIFKRVKEKIPMGIGRVNHIQNISSKTKQDFNKLFNKFKLKDYDQDIFRIIKNKALSNLGSLGQGNHFIELDYFKNELWLVIHTGSRNIGHAVATKYMKVASENENDFEKTAQLKINSIEGKKYLNALNFCLDFALLNRLEIAYKVKKILQEILNDEEIDFKLWTNKNHNHCIFEKDFGYIHRKGATPAKVNEKGIIPANMKDGCFLVKGKGNKDFINSSSHGAGRKLSRTNAKNKLNFEDFKKSMDNIKAEISMDFIDEAPQAYKNIFDVMEKQKDSVEIIKQIKPIINWKG